MTRGLTRVWMAATMALLAVAAPGAAAGAEAVAAAGVLESQWRVEAGAGYAAADAFTGWGLSLHAGRVQGRYTMFGFAVDSTKLHAARTDATGAETDQGFRSTLWAGFFRGQLPTRFVTPYAELALGYTGIHGKEGLALPCDYQGGPNGAVAVGASAQPVYGVAIGLRAGLRLASTSAQCAVARAGSDGGLVVKSLAMTVAYHW